MEIWNKIQPELCLAAPQSQPGRGTGYRVLLKETWASTTHRQVRNKVKDQHNILSITVYISSDSKSYSSALLTEVYQENEANSCLS